ncbi:ATP-binding cassette [Lithospermum erythrorhizon]|uniref:ATP-binding cassette n=1 Tax=Lithospermum erythrorhizon TaxID=34254 RepID=A0AAV3RY30_LITER
MELVTGLSLIVQQTLALLKKNMILSKRNKRATILHLFSSFLFMALLFGMKKANDARLHRPSISDANPDPVPDTWFSIPSCEKKMFMKRPCFDFVWSGSGNQRIQSIVDKIMANNPGRSIPSEKVKSFGTKDELYAWLMMNPMTVPGVLHFTESSPSEIRYGVQTNSSTYVKIGRQYEDPLFKYQIPLQFAASREIARSLLQDQDFGWDVGLTEFAHPSIIETSKRDDNDVSSQFSRMFLMVAAMFGFVFQISALVEEKELKLRQAMTLMGLYDTAYWLSWLTWEISMAFISSLLIVAFVEIFQIEMFKKNNFLVVFLLFFIFQLSLVGFAFFLSVFIRKSSSTTSVSFSVFIIAFFTMVFSPFFYSDSMKTRYRVLWSLFPPNLFSAALNMISDDRDGGLKLSDLSKCGGYGDGCYTMRYYYDWLMFNFFLWFILAIYLDNILPNQVGVRKSFMYFLMPSYWTGKGAKKSKGDNGVHLRSRLISAEDRGVLEEEIIVKQQVKEGTNDPNVAVQLQGLAKTYSSTTKIKCHSCLLCCCYCSCKRIKSFEAVKGLWMNFAKDQLFCLLGPNGAGKTTAIGCLTGIIPVTKGDAIIYGNSIRDQASLSKIRRMTGVCSQFDTLWNKLSGQEHLELFASIKGLHPASIKEEAVNLLADVKLDDDAKVRSGSYSGGMKRRLSVAIALIGNPKLLILDEPTTGMDPITRRHMWDVIEAAKQGRCIILTTHSMEEADILSDRIGIMAKGILRCIGTSTMLKSQFGTGFIVKVSFSRNGSNDRAENGHNNMVHSEAVKEFFRQRLNTSPIAEEKGLTFTISNGEEGLENEKLGGNSMEALEMSSNEEDELLLMFEI